MEMYEEAARIDKYIATAKLVKDGRVELIHYIKEQSISSVSYTHLDVYKRQSIHSIL